MNFQKSLLGKYVFIFLVFHTACQAITEELKPLLVLKIYILSTNVSLNYLFSRDAKTKERQITELIFFQKKMKQVMSFLECICNDSR